jgi:hypothetical protein
MVTSLVDGSLSEDQSRSFYNPSTRSKLKSFEDMTHKTKLKCRSAKSSENRLGSTVPFCLFDRVLNVISIKDIDDNGCKLKTRDLIFYKIKCPLTKRWHNAQNQ